ncbi:unnamed protein product [Allacma fusca]|uniref:Gustatory receptor n=1 Tax=Allacma fusca TaxID=39272 RepID=A0A8J2JCH9_9HEXA|nr:unnamed protein product [Allacma fusca]
MWVPARDLKFYFKLLKFCSKINLFPVDFVYGPKNTFLIKPSSKLKTFAWYGTFAYVVVRIIFINYLLLKCILFEEGTLKYEIVLHGIYGILSVVCISLVASMFMRRPDSTFLIFNSLFDPIESHNWSHSTPKFILMGKTRQQVIAIIFPVLALTALLAMNVLMVALELKFHWYFMLDQEYRTPVIFVVMWFHENYVMWFWGAGAIFLAENMILFFEKVTSSIKNRLESLRCEHSGNLVGGLRNHFLFCLRMGLTMQIFNDGFHATVVFDQMLFFSIAFEKAFLVPEYIKRFKCQVLEHSKFNGASDAVLKLFKKRLNAVANVGVKVGGFHTMERQSTPLFIDFVVRGIATILVAFPGN